MTSARKGLVSRLGVAQRNAGLPTNSIGIPFLMTEGFPHPTVTRQHASASLNRPDFPEAPFQGVGL